jgi:uncharacterized membrane protein
MILDLTWLGWPHTLASALALLAGAWVLVRPKGTPRHKAAGRIYSIALAVACVTSLGIFATGRWFFPHTLAVVTLALLAIAVLAARFKRPRGAWIHIHLTCMLLAYYMLLGGGVNEAFLRIEALRPLGPAAGGAPSAAFGITHGVVMMIFLVWIVAANVATFTSGRSARAQRAA